ncbi:GNAT family N-acetyltransferase [Solirubrobacter sp. CPCC 204708]|uniref:Lysine N-acyltransferase MbtK n=1 Tax=Solirubrobacter deserti TaxID=2282478 RepID=A0ABT4RDI3_9ACTN|nr:GNAT family N-acetyltransferase [Solirubrobacter deserti]MBE2314576.1 GNAT family N-acetyltransferase [Solirubrobacter deserti]MDA0136580.1 GNAT family N-acetyltransferase [Solirubrobacter deserti]
MLAPPRQDAAALAATTTLLNCYLREGGTATFREDRAVFNDLGVEAELLYRSRTLHHRFGPVPVTPTELARRISLQLDPGTSAQALLDRVEASLECVRGYVEARTPDLDRLFAPEPLSFIDSDQALVLGHPLHPTPKGLSGRLAQYAPELQPHFPLHWLSVESRLVVHDSATGTPAPQLAEQLLGESAPPGRILIPAHPWEAGFLARAASTLFTTGAVIDLGPQGAPVTPTSSVRTVYNAQWPYQLKFSLHARVTNSMRVTLPKELRRAVEAKRLDGTIVGEQARAAAPHLTVVHDPAYLQVPDHDGFSVLFRENAFEGDVSALTVLCQDHPFGGRSRLANLAAGREREWFQAYLQTVIVSLVRLYLDVGLTYEPHQQNTLLRLAADGMPEHALIRDSQGYFHREAAHADICAVLPQHGEATESIFSEALADERLVYYPFLNNALGVIDALGAGGGIDEPLLLGDLRDTLARERKAGGRYPHSLLDRLLDDATWPCKANLRTRLHDMDELVGDISTQSVYVTIPNPLTPTIELVEVTESHHELLQRWMREPRVAQWWGEVDDVRTYLDGLGHVTPHVAYADGEPFAYVETYWAVEDELARHYAAHPDDRGLHLLVAEAYAGTGVPRALVRQLVEGHHGRTVCEPDARNGRMLAFCQALGGEIRGEIDLPHKRAALVVWD